jgi:hypothetical protein
MVYFSIVQMRAPLFDFKSKEVLTICKAYYRSGLLGGKT